MVEGIKRFCTPLNGSDDKELFNHILKTIKSFGSDGAPDAQKTGRSLRNRYEERCVHISKLRPHAPDRSKGAFARGAAYEKAWDVRFGRTGCLNPTLPAFHPTHTIGLCS